MSRIKLTLEVVSDLRKLADSIEGLVEVVKSNNNEYEKTNLGVSAPSKVGPISVEEVRAVLMDKSRAGKREAVNQLITSYGVKRLTDIPSQHYSELIQKASEL